MRKARGALAASRRTHDRAVASPRTPSCGQGQGKRRPPHRPGDGRPSRPRREAAAVYRLLHPRSLGGGVAPARGPARFLVQLRASGAGSGPPSGSRGVSWLSPRPAPGPGGARPTRRVCRTPAARGRAPHNGRGAGGRKEEVGTGGQGPFLAPLDHFPQAGNGFHLQVKRPAPGEGCFRRRQGGGAGRGQVCEPPEGEGRDRRVRGPAGGRSLRWPPRPPPPGARRPAGPRSGGPGTPDPQTPAGQGTPAVRAPAGRRGQAPPPPGRARPGSAAGLGRGPTSPSRPPKVKQETGSRPAVSLDGSSGFPGPPNPRATADASLFTSWGRRVTVPSSRKIGTVLFTWPAGAS